MQMLSGPGMVLLVFTVTFASIDWFMSLEPEWFSTIYGFDLCGGVGVERAGVCDRGDGSARRRHEPMNEIVAQFIFTISANCCWRW